MQSLHARQSFSFTLAASVTLVKQLPGAMLVLVQDKVLVKFIAPTGSCMPLDKTAPQTVCKQQPIRMPGGIYPHPIHADGICPFARSFQSKPFFPSFFAGFFFTRNSAFCPAAKVAFCRAAFA